MTAPAYRIQDLIELDPTGRPVPRRPSPVDVFASEMSNQVAAKRERLVLRMISVFGLGRIEEGPIDVQTKNVPGGYQITATQVFRVLPPR